MLDLSSKSRDHDIKRDGSVSLSGAPLLTNVEILDEQSGDAMVKKIPCHHSVLHLEDRSRKF